MWGPSLGLGRFSALCGWWGLLLDGLRIILAIASGGLRKQQVVILHRLGERDVDEDRKLGKHNPISAGTLDFEEQKSDLIGRIESIQCDEMDAILPIEKCYSSFWLI